MGYSPWGCKRVEHDLGTKNKKGSQFFFVFLSIHFQDCFQQTCCEGNGGPSDTTFFVRITFVPMHVLHLGESIFKTALDVGEIAS